MNKYTIEKVKIFNMFLNIQHTLFNIFRLPTTTTVNIYRRIKKKADMAKNTLFYHKTKC